MEFTILGRNASKRTADVAGAHATTGVVLKATDVTVGETSAGAFVPRLRNVKGTIHDNCREKH